jgi:hypothetical protein
VEIREANNEIAAEGSIHASAARCLDWRFRGVVWTASAQMSPSVQRGATYAQANRAECHSIGKVSPSSLSLAPRFRSLHLRYPVERLVAFTAISAALSAAATTRYLRMV